ncbi:thioredoxin [Galactobacter caseinivorans]|uniref:Thioredoxin n=1 Tax=Galactobacter caseinivorans TaxID=2676123 RepID=A0A496PHZ5_9MICC|nr:thioredoxin [Galactobacter caseinivorans]RKW70095.1 thioredoxin [Galactobacter caseinivorans]
MATVNLNQSNFESMVDREGIVLVDFWAAWCGPCQMFGPIFEKSSEQHPDMVFAKVDTEAEQALAGAANITSIPTLMAFRDGVMVFNQAGALPGKALEDLIEQVQALDMDSIRTQIAEAEAAETAAPQDGASQSAAPQDAAQANA